MKRRRERKGNKKIIGGIILILAVAAGIYIYTAPKFERIAPQIKAPESLYWNRKDPLKIDLSDNIALKDFEILLSDGIHKIIVGKGTLDKEIKEQTLLVRYPKSQYLDPKTKKLTLRIVVNDRSMWHFLGGNRAQKEIRITVDDMRPNVNVVAHSYSITQGGSALVVFQAEDENLDKLYVEAGDKKFLAIPYRKEGYYAALIAWPFNTKSFSAKIIATDLAGNKRVTAIPFYLKNHRYRVSWIKVKESFIDGKITDLASSDPEYAGISDKLERFRAINETMRLKNEALIHSLSKDVPNKLITHWKVQKFYPLKNGAKVASYGDERHYYYGSKNNEVSRSYHVGYDLASTKMASIVASNKGTVVFAGENGIYGNMPLINHGLGLYTLYGHCSKLLVKEGDQVRSGQVIAKTGSSGLALGDHLHFGILVQGIEVRPIEWFDDKWIKVNIDKVFKEADRIIEGK